MANLNKLAEFVSIKIYVKKCIFYKLYIFKRYGNKCN